MPENAVGEWISARRFEPYIAATDGDAHAALALYQWNGRVAGALLELIAHVEVLVRNAIHNRLKRDTPDNALHSWLTNAELLQEKQVKAVQDAVAKLKRSGKSPTEDRVVAGLYFSFWSSMVGTAYEQLWRDTLSHAFPLAKNRKEIAGPLNRLVQVRNKLAHHEVLIAEPIQEHVERALFIAGTVDLDARAWVAGTSRVEGVLSERP
jgi:Abi-like protein